MTRTPHDELRLSDLYVHAALHDGFPNAVIEALAAGLCVVATDSPGATGEILGNGKHGFLVPPDDVHSLAEGMRSVMQEENVLAAFAANAQRSVRHLSPDAIAVHWLEEIKKLIGNEQKRSGNRRDNTLPVAE